MERVFRASEGRVLRAPLIHISFIRWTLWSLFLIVVLSRVAHQTIIPLRRMGLITVIYSQWVFFGERPHLLPIAFLHENRVAVAFFTLSSSFVLQFRLLSRIIPKYLALSFISSLTTFNVGFSNCGLCISSKTALIRFSEGSGSDRCKENVESFPSAHHSSSTAASSERHI